MARGSNLAKKDEPSVIEPGLGNSPAKPQLTLVKGLSDPLSELFFNRPIRQHVREFGHIFGLIGLLVALYIAYRGGSVANSGAVAITSLLLVSLCTFTPRVMLPVWRGWMGFARVFERFSTVTILGLMWGLMMIPIGLLLKIIGIRVMDMRYKADVQSYWLDVPAAKTDFQLLERQY